MVKVAPHMLCDLLACAQMAHASSVADAIDCEFSLTKAEGIYSATAVVSAKKFQDMDKYFKNITITPPSELPYDVCALEFTAAATSNLSIFVDMNDSVFVPVSINAGKSEDEHVRFISLEGLIDCVGCLVYHPNVGYGAAHISAGTRLPSLGQMFKPFLGQENVQITLLSSFKTQLLKNVVRFINDNNFKVEKIYAHNVIRQMDKSRTLLKNFFNPEDVVRLAVTTTGAQKKKYSKQEVIAWIKEMQLGAMGVVMRLNDGHVSLIRDQDDKETLSYTSHLVGRLGDTLRALPNWYSERYYREVKPNAKKFDVDIAFADYGKILEAYPQQ